MYAEAYKGQDQKRMEERLLQYFRRLNPQKQEQYLEELSNDVKSEDTKE